MQKLIKIVIIFSFGFILSGCPPEMSTTFLTIKTVRVLFFSFDKNGIFPHLDEFNKHELGIGIIPDSVSERVEYSQAFSFGNNVYARSNPNTISYTNAIDSLNIFTLYDFDANHPAGSNINDILLHLDDMGETTEIEIRNLSTTMLFLKFSTLPNNDSLQFKITGRITDNGTFISQTELVVIP
jgi:hypothetical protein